jgi:hypothetical protein
MRPPICDQGRAEGAQVCVPVSELHCEGHQKCLTEHHIQWQSLQVVLVSTLSSHTTALSLYGHHSFGVEKTIVH